ncbi:MAG: beta-N-acetylhexosaminidase [Akkermansiaceae bacterium]|nr:beta-N-acetylhexosaminidase [Akkermansiaceae bacterium]
MNVRIPTLLAGLLGSVALAAPSARVDATPTVIPQPVSYAPVAGQAGFSLNGGIKVHYQVSRSEAGAAAIRALMAADFTPILPEENEGELTVSVEPGHGKEWYAICVTPDAIAIRVSELGALHLAAQTLAQSVVTDAEGKPALPCMQVEDEPMLGYRGLMLDPCRHPLPVAQIKKMLRIMARYKLNRFHWHLTDDQGWRIEIKKYPKLTEVGSRRDSTPLLTNHEQSDNTPTTPFYYTQEEIQDVVAYANSLGIIVIPEIEIPGHASACIAAYPELGNSDIADYAPKVATTWGVLPYTMAPKEEIFRFIEDVMAEVLPLFPKADMIHIGGDEAPREQWQQSPFACAFMKEHGLTNPGQIQHCFTHRVADMLAPHGRRIIGWDEIMMDGAVPPTAVVMAWRSWVKPEAARTAARRGHDVILSPDSHFYFNFAQGKIPADPFYTPHGWVEAKQDWRHVYSFNPLPDYYTPAERAHIIGLQANCWSESIQNAAKLEYQVVPRICALAEVAWRPASLRNADEFLLRIQAEYPWFEKMNINYRREDGSPAAHRTEE